MRRVPDDHLEPVSAPLQPGRDAALEEGRPEYADVDKVMALFEKGRFAEALIACDEEIKLFRHHASYYARRGIILLELGRFNDAISDFKKADQLDKNLGYEDMIGDALLRHKRYKDAFEWLTRAIERNPLDADGYGRIGCVHLMCRRYEEAFNAFDRAIALNPNYEEILGDARSMSLKRLSKISMWQIIKNIVYNFPVMGKDNIQDKQSLKREITSPVNDLRWPSDKWMASPEKMRRKQHAIVAFLRRVWKPFIDANNLLVTRKMLAMHDPDAAAALQAYAQRNPIPDDIRIVRTRDINRLHAEGKRIHAMNS